ncbi:hypothetical protein AB0C70_17150 [Streptomyces sp. NPDC048564]|uniref:hypothetical protein n=1 Tax=Streptomyces sp. NPDC048564 TaxID=3155760 RepID=UPI0034165BAD
MAGTQTGPDRATALAWLRQALADELDDLMRSSGFERSARSVSYGRPWGGGRQKVDFELIVRPHYAPDAVQVSLSVSFVSAEIAAIARTMLPADDADIVVRKDVIQRSVLDQITPNPPVLKFTSEPEARDAVGHVKSWVSSSVVPYLEARRSVEEFVRLDVRSLMDDSSGRSPRGPRAVVVAAAQRFLGRPEDALVTLEFAYPRESLERTYYDAAFMASPMAEVAPRTEAGA